MDFKYKLLFALKILIFVLVSLATVWILLDIRAKQVEATNKITYIYNYCLSE